MLQCLQRTHFDERKAIALFKQKGHSHTAAMNALSRVCKKVRASDNFDYLVNSVLFRANEANRLSLERIHEGVDHDFVEFERTSGIVLNALGLGAKSTNLVFQQNNTQNNLDSKSTEELMALAADFQAAVGPVFQNLSTTGTEAKGRTVEILPAPPKTENNP